jgi:ATP-dependent protease Clp ATPase subunit
MKHCAFCGRGQNEAYVLVAGPTVHICDKCVKIAAEVIQEKRFSDAFARGREVLEQNSGLLNAIPKKE